MIDYQDIKDVHLEISTMCNANCPWCPRNFWGFPYNDGYPETNLSLQQAKKIFEPKFLEQLTDLRINGNFGDIVMNPEAVDIVNYFRQSNKNLRIQISTNGSARNKSFWKQLALANTEIVFALDGLEDTHHLYRQNTSWKQIIKNAQTFIESGGRAIWKMIEFDHNRHQIKQCEQMSQQLGFANFLLARHGRTVAPVFDKKGQLTHVLGNYDGEKNFEVLFYKKKNDKILLEDILENRKPAQQIVCEAKKMRSIYISANGDVSPCCYTGFYPRTYGHGQYHQAANSQLAPMIKKNNALEYPLKECIQWFVDIENSWNKPTFKDGRLVICNDVCGKNQ